MATSEEIRDAVSDDMVYGEAERQLGDRRTRYFTPAERLAAARELAADASTTGPFVKVGFKSRAF